MKLLSKALLAAGLASVLTAQSDDVLRQKKLQAAADDLKANLAHTKQTFEFVSGQLISGPPVKGAPYSAEVVNESIQTLADGNRIVQRTTVMQYRDTDGRERREETSAMGAIFITDPVAGTRYTLHPETRTAQKSPNAGFNIVSTGADNVFYRVNGVESVAVGGRGEPGPITVRLREPAWDTAQTFTIATAGRLGSVGSDAKTEQLGNIYIEGVQVQGTRTTTTIPAGDIGNDRPINIVDERWYSPDLQMTVLTKHSDPRSGETNFQLKNINRSNPPPTLFEIPADYTVGGGGGGRSGGPAAPAVRVFEQKK